MLDFNQLGAQIRQMSTLARHAGDERAERVRLALRALHGEAANWEHWAAQAQALYKQSPWLLAAPIEPLDTAVDRPARPEAYALFAADGSQIDLDRHGAAECFLINLGLVALRYGPDPACELRTAPQLFFEEREIELTDSAGRRYTMAGPLVHAERDTREGIALADFSRRFALDRPALAMQDGTLIRWSLSALDPWVQDYFLERYLDEGLERLAEAGIPLCSYISRPRAPEVMGLLQLIADPSLANAGRSGKTALDSAPYRGVSDYALFNELLRDGQRSAIFKSMSKINVERYGHHAIHFFYLHVKSEIARIELPAWVLEMEGAVDLIHAIAYDQAQRGGGYPVALARAHEQAVVRETDRRVFRQMVEAALWNARAGDAGSHKAESKEWQRV